MKKKLTKRVLGLTLSIAVAASFAGCGEKSTEESANVAETKTTEQSSNLAVNTEDTEAAEQETQESGNADVPEVVNLGVQTLITPELIARYEKIYEEYLGTEVNIVQFDSGADVNKAFSGNSIDIASLGTSPASIGIANDLGYEVFWFYDVIGSAESLIASKDSGVESVSDLKGRKVATPFASTAHYSLLNALSLEGVEPGDVELLDMQPDDIYAAWKRGDIDAAYVWNPVLGELNKDEGQIITDSGKLAEQGIVTADLGVVSKDFAEKYPNVVTNYVKAQLYAYDIYSNDLDTAVADIASVADITTEDAASQVKDFTYLSGEEQITDAYLGTKDAKGKLAETLKATADFLVEQGSIDSAPELNVFEDGITGEFIEKALSETK